MSFRVGIVGLPNVGKSTLFNAITKSKVEAANYPFATIDPNVGVVAVPDERLASLAKLENSAKIVPTTIEFVDIAGLVSGAHKGEGLGNKFLSHIRDVDAILEVVRAFDSSDIIHVNGTVDPTRDIETIGIELQLADLQSVEKRLESNLKSVRSGDKVAGFRQSALEKIKAVLENGKNASTAELSIDEDRAVNDLSLLTQKPFLFAANSTFNMTTKQYDQVAAVPGALLIDAKLESELSELEDEDRKMYLEELGLPNSGLDRIIQESYKTLDLITFITAGPIESKAWTITKGTKAPQAAGKIHTDFEQGFIRAEVIETEKLLEAGGYSVAREKGWIRLEGKEYVVRDGDVVHFRFAN